MFPWSPIISVEVALCSLLLRVFDLSDLSGLLSTRFAPLGFAGVLGRTFGVGAGQ